MSQKENIQVIRQFKQGIDELVQSGELRFQNFEHAQKLLSSIDSQIDQDADDDEVEISSVLVDISHLINEFPKEWETIIGSQVANSVINLCRFSMRIRYEPVLLRDWMNCIQRRTTARN